MKKRLFLTLLLTIALFCIIAMTVSAESPKEVPAYDRTYNVDGVEYPIWEMGSNGTYHPLFWYKNNNGKMCKVYADNIDSSNAPYVSYANTGYTGEIGGITIYDENGNSYNSQQAVVIANLNPLVAYNNNTEAPVTRIHKNCFQESTVLKAVFLPSTIDYMGWHDTQQERWRPFRKCVELEYIEFPSNSVLTTIGDGAFHRCYKLKAISLPESVTEIATIAFQYCESLEAVYLPKNFLKMNCAGNAEKGSFNQCVSMYFVSEPFVLNSTLSNVPQKESVYYFPSTLTGLGEGIRGCSNMNETLVVGTNYTSHSTSMYEGTGVKTVVYLGNMTYFWMTNTQSTKLNIVFPNSTSLPEIKVSGDQSAGSTIYACKLGKSYILGNGAWKEDNTHFEEISKTVITPSTSCTEPSIKIAFCFCGYEISNEPIEGTVSSHDYDYLNNDKAILVGIVYSNYSQNGEKTVICGNCGEQAILEVPALFTCLGYSAPEDGRGGIAIGFTVNNVAIAEYEEATGKTLKYGVFAVMKDKLGTNDIFAEDGTAAEGVISAEITNYQFVAFELKIVGFTDEQKDTKLAMGAYVAVTDGETTEYSYMQSGEPDENEKYCFVSYNDIVNAPSTDEEATQ